MQTDGGDSGRRPPAARRPCCLCPCQVQCHWRSRVWAIQPPATKTIPDVGVNTEQRTSALPCSRGNNVMHTRSVNVHLI